MGKRLALGFGLILTLLIFVGFLGYWSVKSISGATVGMIHGDAHIAENAAEARAHIVGLRRYEKDLYLNIGSPEKEADYLKKWASEHEELINEHIPQLEKTAALDKDREKIANMKQELASYETGFNQVYADMQAGKIKTPQEANAAINAYKESMHKMEQAAKELAEAGNKRMDLMEPALKSLTGRTLLMMAILIILAMVMSTAIGIVITRSIAGPVREITVSAKNISIGEIEQDVGIMRNDEIGSLADSFRAMVAYLRMISVTAEQIAAGDLTAEVAPKSEKDILGNAFKVMLDGLREIVTEIKNGADQIASAAVQIAATSEQTVKNNETSATAVEETTSTMHEMSANIQNISRSARSQASSVAQTSASIEQLAASTQKIATTAQQLVDLSRNAKKAVALGIESVTQSIQGTEDISKTIIRSADTISALGSRAEDIGKIVEVIDDIAEQTNLLALNAAIEAARAGEQGLGFAVVAEEVRKLAERSAKSTREIAELISGIQKEAIEAVKLMDKSTQIVERGVEMSTQAGSSLREIEGNVLEVDKFAREIGDATHEQGGGSTQIAAASENLSEITHEVTSATDEQATAAEQIVNTMEKMRSVIQQNASASAELASSAEQLRANADTFRKLVGRFELTASQTAGGATGKRKGKNGGNGSRSEYLATGTV